MKNKLDSIQIPTEIQWERISKYEASGLEIEQTIKVKDYSKNPVSSFTVNMYHTKCLMLVNGKNPNDFLDYLHTMISCTQLEDKYLNI